MDDLTEKLSAVLNNPEMMAQIKSLSGLLNSSNATSNSQEKLPSMPPKSSESHDSNNKNSDPQNNNLSPEMITQIMKFAPIISTFNKDDKYTEFLQRLRPLLSEPRQIKLDNALKFFKIMRLIPVLKTQGLF